MLASMFVMGGYSALRNPDQHVRMAGPVTEKLSETADQATAATTTTPDERQLVLINGGAQVAAGLLLATNRLPRLSALVLAASLVPTTAAGHRFWEETDKTQRANQQIHFFKNLSMFGGLLIAAGDTEGKPGVAWRASHAAGAAKLAAGAQAKSVAGSAKGISGAAKGSAAKGLTKTVGKGSKRGAKGLTGSAKAVASKVLP